MKICNYEKNILHRGRGIIINDKGQSLSADVVVLHFDTTGLWAEQDEITRIGAVKISGGQIVKTFQWLGFAKLHKAMSRLEAFCRDCVIVVQHADVVREFFVANAVDKTLVPDMTFVDIFALSILLLPELRWHKIPDLAAALGVEEKNICSVKDKAEYEAKVYLRLVERLKEKEIGTFCMAQDSMEKVLKDLKVWPENTEDDMKKLHEVCYKRARDLYGDKMPELVKERLADELELIAKNEFANIYCLAIRLIEEADLSLRQFGEGGSAGNSLVAYLCGISGEINPLPPHYRCECAGYTEFVGGNRKANELPDKICPHCGKWLVKDGFGLAYQVFMGADGSRMPRFVIETSSEIKEILEQKLASMDGPTDMVKVRDKGRLDDAEETIITDVDTYEYLQKFGITIEKAVNVVNELKYGCGLSDVNKILLRKAGVPYRFIWVAEGNEMLSKSQYIAKKSDLVLSR